MVRTVVGAAAASERPYVMRLRLFLIDADPAVTTALRIAFEPFSEVVVSHGDLLAAAHTAVVSPANSFGFMDGGIDAAFRRFFGPGVEERVQSAISMRPEGHLPVGASLVVDTGNAKVPFMVVAPTMLSPEAVESMNCYRAMRAVLRVAGRDERLWPGLFCPGLGTGVGQVSPEDAAREMAKAYGDRAAAQPANAPDRAGGIISVGRARLGAGPAGDRPYVMRQGGNAMGSVLRVTIILVAAFVIAVVLLNAVELLKLVYWKLRRCPRCRKRLGFAGWDWSEWHNKNVRHCETVNGATRDLPWVVVTCPHCAFEIAVRKAPVFSAA